MRIIIRVATALVLGESQNRLLLGSFLVKCIRLGPLQYIGVGDYCIILRELSSQHRCITAFPSQKTRLLSIPHGETGHGWPNKPMPQSPHLFYLCLHWLDRRHQTEDASVYVEQWSPTSLLHFVEQLDYERIQRLAAAQIAGRRGPKPNKYPNSNNILYWVCCRRCRRINCSVVIPEVHRSA